VGESVLDEKVFRTSILRNLIGFSFFFSLINNGLQLIIMKKASLRFYGELNDYLPIEWQQRAVKFTIKSQNTVSEMLESCTVPYSEIDLILANGKPVGFDYQLQSNDQISIYPIFRSIDIAPLNLINRGYVH